MTLKWYVLVCALASSPAWPEDRPSASGPELGGLNLEQIMDLKVSSVQRREQRLGRSAAAVYVITQEDLRRSGVTSLPEALRLAPGVHVGRIDTRTWAIGTRGSNGVLSNKLLVLIDGRTVYTPIYAGVLWDAQDTLLEDIERIEVFRGPGATMWGANAVNGVINIITKHAARTQGSLVSVGVGTEDRSINRFRHGGRLGDHGFYRAYAQYQRRSPLTTFSGPRGEPWGMLQGGFRLDHDRSEREAITLQGDLYRGSGDIVTGIASGQAPFYGQTLNPYGDSGGNLLARWRRQFVNGSEMTLQAYYDRSDHEFWIGYAAHTGDVDFQHRIPVSRRLDFLWGAEFRGVSDLTRSKPFVARFEPSGQFYRTLSGTLQGEAQLVPERLQLTIGVRVEHTTFSGANQQPTVRLLWTPNRRHALWATASRAVRTPSRLDRSLNGFINYNLLPGGMVALVDLQGNPEFQPEVVRAAGAAVPETIMLVSPIDVLRQTARCRALQIRRYLTKPVDPAALTRTMLEAVSQHRPAARELPVKPAAPNLRGLQILLAEDNRVNQMLIQRLLARDGHEVEVVANGRLALEKARSACFDVILMDIQMPEMDGFAAAAAIREMERERGTRVPIIALTAHALDRDRERCLVAGMGDYIAKPIDSAQLRQKLEALAASLQV